jgi:hypothetical protein
VATRGERLPRLPHLHPTTHTYRTPRAPWAPWRNFPHRPWHADVDRDVRAACCCSYHGVTAVVCCNSTGRYSLCFRPVGLCLRSLLRIRLHLVRNFQFHPTAVRNCTLCCMYVCMSPYHLHCRRCLTLSSRLTLTEVTSCATSGLGTLAFGALHPYPYPLRRPLCVYNLI